MVALKDIKKRHISHIFDTRLAALDFIGSRGYNTSDFTLASIVRTLEVDVLAYRVQKQKELDDAKHGEKLYVGTTTPNIRKMSPDKRSAVYQQLKRFVDIHNDFGVKIIMIHTNSMFKPTFQIPNSEDMALIRERLENSARIAKVVKSQVALDNHKRHVKRMLDSIDPVLYPNIDWKVYNVMSKDDIGLVYTVNGRIKDVTQYILDTLTEEAVSTECVDRKRDPLNCFIKVVLNQVPNYFRTRKRQKLIALNKKDMTFEDMRSIAEQFSLKITILDCEADLVKKWDYAGSINHNGRSVYAIIYNGHTYSLKQQYRKLLSNNGAIGFSNGDAFITPAKHVDDIYAMTEIRVTDTFELRVGDNDTFRTIEDIIADPKLKHSYVCFATNLQPLLQMIIRQKLYPTILSSGDFLICLKFKIGRRVIQIRGLKHGLLDHVPYSHNYTIGSCAMYMFRRFINRSFTKVCDPTIATIFKNMCKPLVYMNPVDRHKAHTYLIDINKAYYSNMSNLGTFIDQPSFKLRPKKITRGIYEHKGRFLTDEECKYEKLRPCDIRYYCEYSDVTNKLQEWADTIYAADDISPSDKKNTVNMLVGKLNPNIDELKHYAIYPNKCDLDLAISKINKKILSIDEINGSYVVCFVYATNDRYIESTNASYLSAQIIRRTHLQVRKKTQELIDQGCTVYGTMTDSILFTSPTKMTFNNTNQVGDWDLQAEGDELVVRGVGQYAIWDNEYIVLHRQLGGYDANKTYPPLERKTKIQPFITPVKPQVTHTLVVGKAGIGKSHYITSNYSRSQHLRLAFNGIAAHNIGGQTISSMFKLGKCCDRTVEASIQSIPRAVRARLQNVDTMVIDEYYTLPSIAMKKVSEILKFIRRDYRPFGGIAMVFVGDDRQTSAVGAAFVDSTLFKSLKIHRLPDLMEHDNMRLTKSYMTYCDKFRNPRVTHIINKLKDSRFSKTPIPNANGVHTVYYTNKDVYKNNLISMANFKGKVIYVQRERQPCEYSITDPRPDNFVQTYKSKNKVSGYIEGKICMKYKKDAPIYITNNGNGLFNGMIGTINAYDAKKKTITVTVDGTIIQRPEHLLEFDPAFSLTIHKAQCSTFEGINIYIDKKDITNNKQLYIRLIYTALTRVRDFDKCYVEVR
jgi:hypothetical protein